MPLGEHTRNSVSGRIRRERSDSLVKHLREDYPILEGINGNTKLGTLEEELGVDSLSQVLRVLREMRDGK